MAELLAIRIKITDVKGIKIREKNLLISQFADDTTLFLKDAIQIPIVVDYIHQFSKASGLRLNIDKCETFARHDQPALSICNIAVKTK